MSFLAGDCNIILGTFPIAVYITGGWANQPRAICR